MGYLIVYVKQAHSFGEVPPLFQLAKRAALGDSTIVGAGWKAFRELLREHGFEVKLPIERVKPNEFPLTCVAYTSREKSGEGRSGSSLYTLPCRKVS